VGIRISNIAIANRPVKLCQTSWRWISTNHQIAYDIATAPVGTVLFPLMPVLQQMQVYISSGSHIDEVTGRVEAINHHLDSPEIVFGEAGEATTTGQIRAIIDLFPKAPLIALGAGFLVLIAYPIGGLILSVFSRGSKGRDIDIMQRIKSQHGAEIREIDIVHPALPIHENPRWWAVLNWLPLIAVPVLASRVYPPLGAIYASVLVLLMFTLVLFLIMLYFVNTQREDAMADIIQSHVGDVDSACIILGEAHHWGVGERLVSHDGVDVINPTPTDPDLTTLLGRNLWGFFDSIRDVKNRLS
jgi:hypothetical protein